MRSGRMLLGLAGIVGLVPALACGGAFQEGWKQGMNSSAQDSLAEARAAVAQCAAGGARDALSAVLDRVEAGLADGSLTGLNANVVNGMVTGGAKDGCDPEDIEVIRSTYPSLVP